MTTETNVTGTLSEKEGDDLFRKAFSEISGNEYKPSAFSDEAPETPTKEETKEPPSTETETKIESPTTPVKEGASTATSPEKVEKAPPATIEQVINEFPEDKRELVKQLFIERNLAEQRFKSHQGRLAAERKQRVNAEQELVKLRTRGVSGPQDPVLAEQAKVDHAKAIDEWKLVVEAEPTLAKAVDALTDAKVNAAEARMKAERDARDTLAEQHASESQRQGQWDIVVSNVPNAAEVIRSPEFQYWRDTIAPPGIRHIAQTSVDAEDALFVLQQYTPYAIWVNQQAQGAANPNPANTDTTVADKISEDRKNKSSPVVTGALPNLNLQANAGNEFDDATADRLFKEAYAKIKNR